MKISIDYKGKMRFSTGELKTDVTMDANAVVGGLGEAPSPKKMILHGLAGCTGMDVVAIMKKKRVEYDDFSIEIDANETKSHPVFFNAISITFKLKADEKFRVDIERAIELSATQFCGVSYMLSKTSDIKTILILSN